MASASPSNSRAAHRVEALQAMLTIMRWRPHAFDTAAIHIVWARLGALVSEVSGWRRVA